jgi:hypothetical protein
VEANLILWPSGREVVGLRTLPLRRVGFPQYNYFQVSGTRMTLLELEDWMWISMKRMI